MRWLGETEEYVSRTGSGLLKIQFVNVIQLLTYINQNHQTHSSIFYDVSFSISYSVIMFSSQIVIQCPLLLNPVNGVVQFTNRVIGAIAVYSCNIGYRLEGRERQVCQQNSLWSEQSPSCEGIE